MTTLEVLQKARGFVARGWCQGKYAVNSDGRTVLAKSTHAAGWCMLGALLRASECGDAYGAEMALASTVHRPLSGWNDAEGRTQAEVLAAFDAAIASLTNNC